MHKYIVDNVLVKHHTFISVITDEIKIKYCLVIKGENQSRSGNKQTNLNMEYIQNPTWATCKESAPTTTTIIILLPNQGLVARRMVSNNHW